MIYKKYTENRSISDGNDIFEQRLLDANYIYEKYSNSFIYRSCPICGSDKFVDKEKFNETYSVSNCTICNSLYINPCPDSIALSDYYENCRCNKMLDEIYRKRYDKSNNFVFDDRVESIVEYLSQIEKSDVNILEIGCGSGGFLSKLKQRLKVECQSKNISFTGIDIDSNSIKNCVDKDLNLINVSAEDYLLSNIEKFDLVVHFELIEHLVDPFHFMISIKELLRDEGLVIFTVPNAEGLEMKTFDYNDYRILAHSIFPPMHINAFSALNITLFAVRCGFNVVSVETPGRLDVDAINVSKNHLKDEYLLYMTTLDDKTKNLIQYIIVNSYGSSHMRVVLKK